MDKRIRLDNMAVGSLGVACVLLLAGWITASAQLAAEHERQSAWHPVALAADGTMKVTVTGDARQADAIRHARAAAARREAAQKIAGQAGGMRSL